MSTARRFVRNVLSLMVSRPVSKLAAFVVSVWQVRYLGRKLVGVLDTAVGFVTLFAYISDFGTQHFVVREVSRDRSTTGAYLNNFLSFQLLLSAFLFVLIVLMANLLGYDSPVKQAIYLAGIGLILVTSMFAPFKAVFHAHEAIHISAFLGVVLASTNALVTVVGIVMGLGVRYFAGVSIFSGLTLVVLSYFLCKHRFVRPVFSADLKMWWRMLKMSFPFALLIGAGVIHARIDVQMLYAMKGKEAVGYYSAVQRLVHPLMMLGQDIMAAMYPVLSRKYVGPGDKFRFIAEKAVKYVAALAIPMAVGAFLLSERIILLLYREQFLASVPALRMLSWTLAIGPLTVVITYSAVAAGRVLSLAAFNAAAAFADVILNLVLIPRYSFEGAAVSTLACEAALLAGLIYYMVVRRVAAFPWRDIAKIGFAALVMGGFVIVFRSASLFVVVPAAAVIYCGVLLFSRFLGSEEKELLKSVFRRA